MVACLGSPPGERRLLLASRANRNKEKKKNKGAVDQKRKIHTSMYMEWRCARAIHCAFVPGRVVRGGSDSEAASCAWLRNLCGSVQCPPPPIGLVVGGPDDRAVRCGAVPASPVPWDNNQLDFGET